MGENETCSWDDRKRAVNIANHGYDLADLVEVFDGRDLLSRLDARKDYREARYNLLAEIRGRVVNITVTPRGALWRLIFARPASRDERKAYESRKPKA